jgi:hypothetical protein
MSMITHFMGTQSRVISMNVPFLCGECKLEHVQVLEVTRDMEVPAGPACPRCGSRMHLDDLAETYNEALHRV